MTGCSRSTNLLLLPGMMCDARMWTNQVNALAGECSITVADIAKAADVSSIARQVLEAAPPQFAMAGLSMGGIVALEMWRQAPERIERLALLDSNYKADAPDRRRIRERQIERANNGALRSVLRDELKPNYLAACHQTNLVLLDEVLRMGIDLGPEIFVRQSLALRDRPDSAHTLHDIDCPVLILCGEEDTLCPVSLHEEMAAAINGSQLRVVPDCGHLSAMEQPGAVNSALHEWLGAA